MEEKKEDLMTNQETATQKKKKKIQEKAEHLGSYSHEGTEEPHQSEGKSSGLL